MRYYCCTRPEPAVNSTGDDSRITFNRLEGCAGAGAGWLRWGVGGCHVAHSSGVFADVAGGVWCHPTLQKVCERGSLRASRVAERVVCTTQQGGSTGVVAGTAEKQRCTAATIIAVSFDFIMQSVLQ